MSVSVCLCVCQGVKAGVSLKEPVRVCACEHIYDSSSSDTQTLANWEGRICFYLDWAVWESFLFTCSLDFGYVKLNGWKKGKVVTPALF